MASGETSQGWLSSAKEKAGVLYKAVGFGRQEESDKYPEKTTAPTSEMAAIGRKTRLGAKKENETRLAAEKENETRLAAKKGNETRLAAKKGNETRLAAKKGNETRLAAKKGNETRLAAKKGNETRLAAKKENETRLAAKRESEPPKLESQHPNIEAQLKDSMVDSELMETQVKQLLAKNKELNATLQERDQQIIALQQEASIIARKNQDLEARLSKSKHKDLLDQIREAEQKLMESEDYIRKQSEKIVSLKDEHSIKQSEEIAKSHELEDELAKVKEDFESARCSLEQEKANNEFLLAKLSTHAGLQTHPDSDECFNKVCVEKQLLLNKLLKEEESSKHKVSGLQKLFDHLRATYEEVLKEKDEAITACEVAKAEADIFKADFLEERRDREKAQGALEAFTNKKNYTTIMKEQIAPLQQQVAVQKEIIKSHKMEIAKLKSSLQSSGGVVDRMKLKIEEQNRAVDELKKKAAKISQLEMELHGYKKSMKDVQSKLGEKVTELSLAQKECEKLSCQVSHGTFVQVTLTDSLDKAEKNLADSNKEVQELKRSNRKLEDLVKKKEKSSLQQYSMDRPVDSSFEQLYDDEMKRNLDLKSEIEYLNGRIEDLTKEVQRRRALVRKITEHKGKVNKGTQTFAEQPPFHPTQTITTKSATGNTTEQSNIYEPIPADSGHSGSKSNAVHTTPVPQNTLPLPPKGLGGKPRAQSDVVFDNSERKVYGKSHEALHDNVQNRHGRKMDNMENDNAESSSIGSRSAIPVGKDGNPLRAGGIASRSNADNVSSMPKGKDGYPLRAGGVASQSRLGEVKQSEHENSREAPKPMLYRLASTDNTPGSAPNSQFRRPSQEDNCFKSVSKENCGHGSYSNSHQEESNTDQYEHPSTWNQPHQKIIPDSQQGMVSGPYSYPSSTSSNRLRASLQNDGSSSQTMSGGLSTESRSGDFKLQQYSDHGSVDVRDLSHGVGKNYSYHNDQMNDPPDHRRDQQYYQHSEAEASGVRKAEMTDRVDCQNERDKQQFSHTGADAGYMHDSEMTNRGEYQRGRRDQHDRDIVAYRREGEIIDSVHRHCSRGEHQRNPNIEHDAACLPDVQGNVQQMSGNQEFTCEVGSNDGSHISYPTLNSENVDENESHQFNPDIPGESQDLSGHQFQEHAAALHAGTSDPRCINSEQSNSSEQISQSNQVESACLTSKVDLSNQTKPIPKPRQHFSSDEVPSTLKKDDSEDESLHQGIDHDIEIVAKGVENEVNRDPSLEITVNEKPYDPNLVCPICGRKFRIGEIQKFRKHVDACV